MLIKDSQQGSLKEAARDHLGKWPRYLALVIVAFALFAGGIAFQRSVEIGPLIQSAKGLAREPFNIIEGALADPDRLTIDISFEDYQRLVFKRQQALERGILVTDVDSWVPARIRYKASVIRCKIRLKGDLPDHLQSDKWSFRINLRDDSTLYGMKRFSLHSPHTRQFIWEWIYHQAMKREGLIALRYNFVNVTVNGEDHGLYALEESFEKRLLEHNQRREGPIIKFDETNWWTESEGYVRDYALPGVGHFHSLPIDMFQTSKTLKDSALLAQFEVAHSMLEEFRGGQTDPDEVFDTEGMATFYALTDVLGGFHALNIMQYRFYYNPVTSRLEEIPFDANAGRATMELVSLYKRDPEFPWTGELRTRFTELMFRDTNFYRAYLSQLERFTRVEYLDTLFAELQPTLDSNLALIHSDYPSYNFSTDIAYRNQKFIRTFTEPVRGIRSYAAKVKGDSLFLQVAATQQLPVEITRVTHAGGDYVFEKPIVIAGLDIHKPAKYHSIAAPLGKKDTAIDFTRGVSVEYRILGQSKIYHDRSLSWPGRSPGAFASLPTHMKPNFKKFSFLDVNETDKTVTFKSGACSLNKPLVIPPGYTVYAGSGVVINFKGPKAALISYSPLMFEGTQSSPVVVFANDDAPHAGIVVIDAGGKSVLQHAQFEALGAPQKERWALSGAVTFYRSPAEISSCRFSNNHSEDALNFVLSPFSIVRSVFAGIQSDGIDADFSDGLLRDVSFEDCGNDAIDISGSRLSGKAITIRGAGDKGLSVGEHSNAELSGVRIRNSEIAVASKDLSNVTISALTLDSCHIGFTVFQKKSEFGPASVVVSDAEMRGVEIPHLVENNSSLTVNGATVTPNEGRVKDLLYGVKYGKSSK